MTFPGHHQNGIIILDTPTDLPEGEPVIVRRARKPAKKKTKRSKRSAARRSPKRKIPTLYERLKDVIGIVEGPPDLAENHNHYAHGAPKRPVRCK
jgi:hypothetical protein